LILVSPFLNADIEVTDKEKSPSCVPKKLCALAKMYTNGNNQRTFASSS